jgi:hypothetical protein
MDESTFDLPLIDEARLHAALAIGPGGAAWEVAAAQRVTGTGWETEMQRWTLGPHEKWVVYRGPSVTGLGNADLDAERNRLIRIRDAAQAALDVVEGHQRFRAGLR